MDEKLDNISMAFSFIACVASVFYISIIIAKYDSSFYKMISAGVAAVSYTISSIIDIKKYKVSFVRVLVPYMWWFITIICIYNYFS